MTDTSAIIIPDASTLSVDTSCIDVSEVELQEDKDFLLEKGTEILQIIAAAALEVAMRVVEIQDELEGRCTGKLKAFYESIGLKQHMAERWACKYRAFCAVIEQHGGDEETVLLFERMDGQLAQRVMNLPSAEKSEILALISEGDVPTYQEVAELTNKRTVKLSKGQELLAAARSRKSAAEDNWEEAKSDPEIKSGTPEYQNARNAVDSANLSIKKFEQQIADLTAQIEEEKLKTAEEAEAKKIAEADKASMEKELQKLKFDDAKVRAERVKKLSTTLTVSIPQALADVSKFFAEIDHYPEEVRQHIYNSAKSLANEIADKL